MIGRPGRIGALQAIFDHIAGKDGAWLATREQIARHWIAHSPQEAGGVV
jgi:hypothetical protein